MITKNRDSQIGIAVIDNGIDETSLKKPLEHKIYIDHDGACISYSTNIELGNFMHGTICAMIIEKYLPHCSMSSVKILNENGMGMIGKLRPALEWCMQHHIRIVNLSLGTTHFKEKEVIRDLINHYANCGLCMIAATANSGYVTYPAYLANSVGVAMDGNEKHYFMDHDHLGIDVLTSMEHKINVGNGKITVQKSNSYAASYITALVGKLFLEKNVFHIEEVKQELRCISEKSDICLLGGYCEPNWISSAVVRSETLKSKAAYYFHTVNEAVREEVEQADTFIIDHLRETEDLNLNHKNIIYMGNKQIEKMGTGKFFWSPYIRFKQILNCKGKEKLDIPVILCEFDDSVDEMLLLTELREKFSKDDYNMYTASFIVQSVLYDLEYLPVVALDEEHLSHLNSFICLQTHYKQSDGLLLGMQEKHLQKAKQLPEVDLQISLKACNQEFIVTFFCENKIRWEDSFHIIDSNSIGTIYQNIKKLLVENNHE